ncbi:hypothetical protein JXA85_08260 [Candidatus Woesearchaeota archaeon]|nr:hypothetical protein [Candidatus Woesearchaeota archaeon]
MKPLKSPRPFHFRGKAQMEILGLAIVVVLLTLVALISLRFFVIKEPSTARKEFVESELAGSFLNTLMKTSSGCKKTNFAELLQDCALMNSINCDAQDSCTYAASKIEEILRDSLGAQEKYYAFSVNSFPPITITNYPGGFSPKTVKSKQYLIPLNPGTLVARLDIAD